ncbi:LAQU0S07e04588g1_1 [Lachancea quebecensis]|uniref:mRNA m(6)A methyltransferase n=1 Tax=Lachancea quebecensis TaxID=1654605 RepID=A0A0P1KSL7_9SACH|nr:LAQU0S07e04588g1_1 [Lachancea quebecensis]
MNTQLVKYLIENHAALLSPPVSGDLANIYILFALASNPESAGMEQWEANLAKFWQEIREIADLCAGCFVFASRSYGSATLSSRDVSVEYIDVQALKMIHNSTVSAPVEFVRPIRSLSCENAEEMTLSDRLLSVLDSDAAATPNKKVLAKLEHFLSTKPASYRLGHERAQKFTPHSKFIPVCGNRSHTNALANIASITGNRVLSLDGNQLAATEQNIPGLSRCVQSKIHHIPNLKPQTDKSLGDCSYLDTCHKLSTCRYMHYLQYVPESLVQAVAARSRELNDLESDSKSICLYTRNLCCSVASKSVLPAQWIQCDVRKFDFSVLGQFSVVVADPAWNIRMNLPYGTCNDSELTDLPLELLQNEGVLFLWVTGRAIEVGKESLRKWGYEVCNQISWVKTNQLGRTIVTGRTGHWLNHSKEQLLVGLKGQPEWLNRQCDVDLIVSSSRETSRKPDELYEMIERMVGPHARKLEIFGRDHNTRPGWFTIGNQLAGDSLCEPDVQQKYRQFLHTQRAGPGRSSAAA